MSDQVLTRRILRCARQASDDAWQQGIAWYPAVQAWAESMANRSGYRLDSVACAIAHLSPQLTWTANKRSARTLILSGERYPGTLHASYERAQVALAASDPWETFSSRANKTRSFARNITGDHNAVTVDTWIARVCGLASDRAAFDSARLYESVADSYRAAARKLDVSPAELQAITWVAVRNRQTDDLSELAA